MDSQRRSLLASGGVALVGLAAGATFPSLAEARSREPAAPTGGTAVPMSDADLLTAFAKARYALDDRVTIGWVDAITYAFIDGATYPLYRLRAGTWVRMRRVDDLHFVGRTIETAYFFDPTTDELLTKLKMPVTGTEVEVKPYRAGPSKASLGVREEQAGTFRMAGESRDGSNFFREGQTKRRQSLSQPMREGDDFLVREDQGTRVSATEGGKPIFFYSEWTITRANWKEIKNPKLQYVDSTLQYSAIAAFRPWMKMDGVEGHTLQNGRGGRARTNDDLPPRYLEMVRRQDPDLLEDPARVLGALP
jgi:hypothetical protein